MNSYIYVNGEKFDSLESYTSGGYDFHGANPLPRVGEHIKKELQDFNSYTELKGYTINIYEWVVTCILHNMSTHEIEIHVLQVSSSVKYYKPGKNEKNNLRQMPSKR